MSPDQPGQPGQPGQPAPDPTTAEAAIRVVRGNPTPEETAALVTVLAAASASAADAGDDSRRSGAPSLWNDRSRLGRSLHRVGPGAWRGAARRG